MFVGVCVHERTVLLALFGRPLCCLLSYISNTGAAFSKRKKPTLECFVFLFQMWWKPAFFFFFLNERLTQSQHFPAPRVRRRADDSVPTLSFSLFVATRERFKKESNQDRWERAFSPPRPLPFVWSEAERSLHGEACLNLASDVT